MAAVADDPFHAASRLFAGFPKVEAFIVPVSPMCSSSTAPSSRRTDIEPALRICKSMIGFFTLWTLDLSQPTLAEKWDSFVQLASDLYPSGPDQDADLPRHGNGRAVWRAVLEQARLGRGPSASKLLREMTADYPKNPDLALLQRDHDLARGA